jgi:mercuric ion transport protein
MSNLATDPRPRPRAPAPPPITGRGALYVGGLAAILASTCCLGPLVLLLLGFSGAWIGNLTALEPYRPLFIVAAVVALFFAYRRIFRPAAACTPGEVCAVPQVRTTYKVLFGLVALLILVAIGFPFVAPLFY